MIPLDITLEVASEPQTFAHIRSFDGVVGHAAEVKARIPVGTWLTLQPELYRLAPYLVEKCGFAYHGEVKREQTFDLLLRRED